MSQNHNIIADADKPPDNINSTDFDLEFQNFYINNDISAVYQNNTHPTTYFEKLTIFSIESYSKFFNIDANQIIQRCIHAIFPKNNFLELIEDNPDLYGPFWVSTTVIFVMFFTSTITEWIKAHISKVSYNCNILTFTKACSLIYGIWGLLTYYQCKLKLNEYFCLYGYAMSIWIPVAIVNIILLEIFNLNIVSNIIRWIFILIGFLISSLFLLKELKSIMYHMKPASAKLILLFVLLCHAIITRSYCPIIQLIFRTLKIRENIEVTYFKYRRINIVKQALMDAKMKHFKNTFIKIRLRAHLLYIIANMFSASKKVLIGIESNFAMSNEEFFE
ncbi:hypothetical protein PCK1_002000 [Pneumocystis canis]|nr:hypothetical protein PCK1_002000 [Pneumocystis canis]